MNLSAARFFLGALGALSLAGCALEARPGLPDNDPADYAVGDAYVDEYGNKGIVAYIEEDAESDFRLVMVLSADETVAAWGPADVAVYPVPEHFNTGYPDGFVFGLEMAQRVELLGIERFPAFAWCHAKNKDRKGIRSSSWMLPTMRELSLVFMQGIDVLNDYLAKADGDPIPVSDDNVVWVYWTSVEDIDQYLKFADSQTQAATDYDQQSRAVCMTSNSTFFTNKQKYWTKDREWRVRAIKYIYLRE